MERGCWLLLYVFMANPTTDQLRDDIDKGRTGEKIAMPDPATAPLGTDAEAGGSPPTPQERKLEKQSAPWSPGGEGRPAVSGGVIYLLLIVVVAIVAISTVFLAAD
jgi:hypothetical protein